MIPWSEIETMFLDAGNTLVSIDFPWVAAELAALGVPCDVASLARAEASARPSLSRWLAGERSTESGEAFHFYVRTVLARLEPARARGEAGIDALAAELVPALARRRGEGGGLWRFVLPGVPEALASLRALGLRLVVVSNSDGSVDALLAELGLRAPLHAVVDSAVVGHEKPDPRIFERALEAAGSPARERVVHVGDLFHADVVGARAAGVHPVLLDPYDDWPGVDCARARDLAEVAQRVASSRAR